MTSWVTHRGLTAARRGGAALALALLGALVPAGARADEQPAAVAVFTDDFRSGFDTTNDWWQMPVGSLPEGDGIATTSASGLKVVPTATDPATGEPAFAHTTGQQSAGGQGDADHLKWLAWPQRTSSQGFPGFDTPGTGKLACATRMAVRTTGTERHPFGAAVTSPRTDPRLAAGSLVTIDPETNLVFDFFVTDNRVYAFYERLRSPGSTYAAFSYAVPVATIAEGQSVAYEIALSQGGTQVTWKVNGVTVLTVDRIGTLALDRRHLLIDHGGIPQTVAPRQLQCALGTFTLLDGAGADGKGLVRLDSTENAYYKPSVGAPQPQAFHDDRSLSGSRLWGQGAQLRVSSFTVSSSRPAS
ncbi:DUF6081 family protein [Streptomyces sp. NPDC001595]|uniref:DUF6081 family protein n=1 Tax=Streptomyces sp. NPDC001532 TaxID=3154520 RepID=UPI003321674C